MRMIDSDGKCVDMLYTNGILATRETFLNGKSVFKGTKLVGSPPPVRAIIARFTFLQNLAP